MAEVRIKKNIAYISCDSIEQKAVMLDLIGTAKEEEDIYSFRCRATIPNMRRIKE